MPARAVAGVAERDRDRPLESHRPSGRAKPSGAEITVRGLQPRWPAILQALSAVGEVVAQTANEACVHECIGAYGTRPGGQPPQAAGGAPNAPVAAGADFRHWARGFVVVEGAAGPDRPAQRSLQFFDAAGAAVHKVFMRPDTALDAWLAMEQHFGADATPRELPPHAPTHVRGFEALGQEATGRRPVDVAGLRREWVALRGPLDLAVLLARHGLTRLQALHVAEPRFALRVDEDSARDLLRAAAVSETPVVVAAGNPGMVQVHSGTVRRVEASGPCLRVADPGFRLHLREDLVEEAWLVRRPTSEGLATSLELFDLAGRPIALFSGKPAAGRPESCSWRRLTDPLAADPAWAREQGSFGAC